MQQFHIWPILAYPDHISLPHHQWSAWLLVPSYSSVVVLYMPGIPEVGGHSGTWWSVWRVVNDFAKVRPDLSWPDWSVLAWQIWAGDFLGEKSTLCLHYTFSSSRNCLLKVCFTKMQVTKSCTNKEVNLGCDTLTIQVLLLKSAAISYLPF